MTDSTNTKLFNDSKLAELLSLSCSWVRKQRWLRRGGQPHVLTIDPIMIGSAPRYRASDVEAWLATLEPANDNVPVAIDTRVDA